MGSRDLLSSLYQNYSGWGEWRGEEEIPLLGPQVEKLGKEVCRVEEAELEGQLPPHRVAAGKKARILQNRKFRKIHH